MKLQKGCYLINATKQPNEIYPVDNLRIETRYYDKWGVCDIFGTISDKLKQTVNSIDVSDRWCWFTDRTPTQYVENTTSAPVWYRSITKQLSGTIETLPMIPVYLPSNIKPYGIKKVIFHDPATIVLWEDETKTVVKCQEGDTYSKEVGLAMCMLKKYMGNKGNFNEVFKKYCSGDGYECGS